MLPLTDSKGASSCNQQLARGVTGSRSCCYQSCYQRQGDREGEEQMKSAQYGRAAATKMQESTESEIFF